MASSHVGVLTSSEPVNGKTIRSLIEVLSDYLFGQLDIGWLIGLPVPKGDLISQSGEVALLFHTRVVPWEVTEKRPETGHSSNERKRLCSFATPNRKGLPSSYYVLYFGTVFPH